MGKALAAFLRGFQRRMGDVKSQKLFQLLKLRIMSPNKDFRGDDTEEINEFQK